MITFKQWLDDNERRLHEEWQKEDTNHRSDLDYKLWYQDSDKLKRFDNFRKENWAKRQTLKATDWFANE